MQQKERNPAKSHKFTTKVDVFPRFHAVFSHVFFHVSTSTSWHKVQGKILDVSFLKNLAYVESQGKIPKVTSSKPTSSKLFPTPQKQKQTAQHKSPRLKQFCSDFFTFTLQNRGSIVAAPRADDSNHPSDTTTGTVEMPVDF